MQDTFTVHKGHIKCTVVQKEAHWPPFLVLIVNEAIYIDIKNILYKKSLILLITGTNLLNASLGEGNSSLFKWRVPPFSKWRWLWNSKNTLGKGDSILFKWRAPPFPKGRYRITGFFCRCKFLQFISKIGTCNFN